MIAADVRPPLDKISEVTYKEVDLRNIQQVEDSIIGAELVYQTAAIIDWSPAKQQLLLDVNIKGNQNVIDACVKQHVPKLVYTSSIDSVFKGEPISNGNETLPYPNDSEFLDNYSLSKKTAEEAVLQANGKNGLTTCALRVAGLYGPNDNTRLPAVIGFLREGSYMTIGKPSDNPGVFNHLYIENAAYAHVLAGEVLSADSALAGQAYFITDHPATNFYQHISYILTKLGYDLPKKTLGLRTALIIAKISEFFTKLKGSKNKKPPMLTKYTVTSTVYDFSFSHDKATRDFGYQPIVDFDTAIDRTVQWLKENGYGPN